MSTENDFSECKLFALKIPFDLFVNKIKKRENYIFLRGIDLTHQSRKYTIAEHSCHLENNLIYILCVFVFLILFLNSQN